MECRYLIGGYIDGAIECFVTYNNPCNGICSVRIGEKRFDVSVGFFKLIAKPAP